MHAVSPIYVKPTISVVSASSSAIVIGVDSVFATPLVVLDEAAPSSQSILKRVTRGLVARMLRKSLSNCGTAGGFSFSSGSLYSLLT